MNLVIFLLFEYLVPNLIINFLRSKNESFTNTLVHPNISGSILDTVEAVQEIILVGFKLGLQHPFNQNITSLKDNTEREF